MQSILTDYVKGNLPRAIFMGTLSMACFHESANLPADIDGFCNTQLPLL